MNNPITEKSVRFLAQPYTIVALALYAVNEFILQRHFPSVISGKLSDFAWLFIAPVILTLLFSLMLPSKRTNTVPILAFALTAIGFTAIKTIPAANTFLLQTWQTIFHHPASIAMDATDLLALLVLSLSWRLWLNKDNRHTNRIHQTALVISFFALLTLADAQMYDAGVYDLFTYEDQIVANSTRAYFCSQDGGLSWNECNFSEEQKKSIRQFDEVFVTEIDIPQTQIKYRVNQLGLIQKSIDNGESWEYEYCYDTLSNVYEYYLENYHPYGYFPFEDGGDIFYDEKSGNTIFTMGMNGLIVVDQDDNFLPIGTNYYPPAETPVQPQLNKIIVPFILPSIFITVILLAISMMDIKKIWHWVYVIFALVLCFLLLTSLFPFSTMGEILFFYTIPFITFIALLTFSITKIINFSKQKRIKWYIPIMENISAGALFFLTYMLWYWEIIPSYGLAEIISFSIIVLFIIHAIYQSYQLKKSLGESNE